MRCIVRLHACASCSGASRSVSVCSGIQERGGVCRSTHFILMAPGTIRRATQGDHATIVSFNKAMALETEGIELDQDVIEKGVEAVLSDPSKGLYFISEVKGTPVAQMMITLEWSDWRNRQMWWIQSVYTVPGARRQGHFRALYEHVQREAEREGAGGLRLYVDEGNERAQETYRRMGMQCHYKLFEQLFTRY